MTVIDGKTHLDPDVGLAKTKRDNACRLAMIINVVVVMWLRVLGGYMWVGKEGSDFFGVH